MVIMNVPGIKVLWTVLAGMNDTKEDKEERKGGWVLWWVGIMEEGRGSRCIVTNVTALRVPACRVLERCGL